MISTDILSDTYDTNWPGWPVSKSYGDEFDGEARNRMILGSRKLIPYILNYKKKLEGRICEIGPFFNPLILHKEIIGLLTGTTDIVFVENDPFAIDFLNKKIDCEVFDIDLNDINERNKLHDYTSLDENGGGVDLVIVSQTFNYIDYKSVLNLLFEILKPNGLIFINNSIDYGIPSFFSERRPRSNNEIIDFATSVGYNIVEMNLLPKSFEKEVTDRLILVLSK